MASAPLIVLDPGHGRYNSVNPHTGAIVRPGKNGDGQINDTGAQRGPHSEVQFNDAMTARVALSMRDRNYAVRFTRQIDAANPMLNDLSAEDRAYIQQLNQNAPATLPDRFNSRIETGAGEKILHLSIHANASTSPAQRGVEFYTHTDHPANSPSAQWAEQLRGQFRSNGTLNETPAATRLNTGIIAPQPYDGVGNDIRGKTGSPDRHVVNGLGHHVGGVVAELGYITNDQDLDRMRDPAQQREAAERIATATDLFQQAKGQAVNAPQQTAAIQPPQAQQPQAQQPAQVQTPPAPAPQPPAPASAAPTPAPAAAPQPAQAAARTAQASQPSAAGLVPRLAANSTAEQRAERHAENGLRVLGVTRDGMSAEERTAALKNYAQGAGLPETATPAQIREQVGRDITTLQTHLRDASNSEATRGHYQLGRFGTARDGVDGIAGAYTQGAAQRYAQANHLSNPLAIVRPSPEAKPETPALSAGEYLVKQAQEQDAQRASSRDSVVRLQGAPTPPFITPALSEKISPLLHTRRFPVTNIPGFSADNPTADNPLMLPPSPVPAHASPVFLRPAEPGKDLNGTLIDPAAGATIQQQAQTAAPKSVQVSTYVPPEENRRPPDQRPATQGGHSLG